MNVPAQSREAAWQRLLQYLLGNWREIVGRGSFDLSKAFPGDAARQAVNVHLFFVEQLRARLAADQLAVDLDAFAAALRQGLPHPDVTLLVADTAVAPGRLLSHDSEVSVLRQGDEIYSALWTHLAHPVAVKICYVKSGAPVREPAGFPWHPARQRKIVKLSPYKGDTEPLVARRDLRI